MSCGARSQMTLTSLWYRPRLSRAVSTYRTRPSAPDRTRFPQLPDRGVVLERVPDHQATAASARRPAFGVLDRRGQRLLDQDVLPASRAAARSGVAARRGGDDDGVHVVQDAVQTRSDMHGGKAGQSASRSRSSRFSMTVSSTPGSAGQHADVSGGPQYIRIADHTHPVFDVLGTHAGQAPSVSNSSFKPAEGAVLTVSPAAKPRRSPALALTSHFPQSCRLRGGRVSGSARAVLRMS